MIGLGCGGEEPSRSSPQNKGGRAAKPLRPTELTGYFVDSLLGLGPLFFRHKGGEVVEDERDRAIRRRSVLIAYTAFWLAFVAACVSLPAVYGWKGSVPVPVVQSSVWCGLILVVGVMSVATLVQYRRGTVDAA
jgi:hypothetical protein